MEKNEIKKKMNKTFGYENTTFSVLLGETKSGIKIWRKYRNRKEAEDAFVKKENSVLMCNGNHVEVAWKNGDIISVLRRDWDGTPCTVNAYGVGLDGWKKGELLPWQTC